MSKSATLSFDLYQGQVLVLYALGTVMETVSSSANSPISDNEWHTVSVTRFIGEHLQLIVDSSIYTAKQVSQSFI